LGKRKKRGGGETRENLKERKNQGSESNVFAPGKKKKTPGVLGSHDATGGSHLKFSGEWPRRKVGETSRGFFKTSPVSVKKTEQKGKKWLEGRKPRKKATGRMDGSQT